MGIVRRVAVVALALVALVVADHVVLAPPAPTVPVSAPPVVPEAAVGPAHLGPAEHRDVVVYGGTPAGAAAALAATRHSAEVTLVVAGSTVGGMMSNGISASDIGSPLAVQGVMLEFFERVRPTTASPGPGASSRTSPSGCGGTCSTRRPSTSGSAPG